MSFFGFLGSSRGVSDEVGIREIFPLSVATEVFVKYDVRATYTKILTDTLERTHGLKPELVPLLFDNCLESESQRGLIAHLVHAMVDRSHLFLVYNAAVGVLRRATSEEADKIRADYKKSNQSKVGVYLSFQHYHRTEMMLIYSALEYCILSSLHKTVNISKAVQFKMSDLRSSVSLADAGVAGAQARALAEALRGGKDILLDAKDLITTATPNIDPTEKAIDFLDAKRAYYLDLPLSYIRGEQTPGIGSTGEADMRAVERGLKQYFFSIIHPVLKALFGAATEFRSQDFRQSQSALEALKAFELTSDEYLSRESKQDILARMFAIDPDVEAKRIEKEAKENPPAPAPVIVPVPAASITA